MNGIIDLSTNSIWISTDLVLNNTNYGENERVLIMTGESVDLIEAIAGVAAEVAVYDMNFSTLKRLRHYVRMNNVQFFDSVYPTENNLYDTAIVFVPKGREFGRGQMWSAMNTLKPNGDLYIVGPNKGGAKTLIKDARQAFSNSQVLGYKKSHRIAVTKKNDDLYKYPADWGTLPSNKQFIELTTPLGDITVATQPGIFSWDELDEGTSYLLDNLVLRDAKTVLDMGCGYGVIGAGLAARVEHVTMVDNNLLAVACARETVKRNKLDNVTVLASDLYSELDADNKFDLIISNPPFHRGFEVSTNVTRRLIEEAPYYLKEGGRLVLVANEFLKYEQDMSQAFKQSNVRAKNSQFKILEGVV